ncbi:MAG: general secretion pathway protein GspB [Candidatus Aminicenantes bacterium]|nr:MAG: general secretion pathway protein GspB [Candidatus Aminicenantes bacterium]
MSSILRALKKLDEDSMAREPGTGEQKQKIKMRQVVSRRTRSSRLINRLLFMVLAVLLVGAAAWIFINSISSNQEPPLTKERDHSPKKPALTHSSQQVPTVPALKKSKPPAPGGEQSKPSAKPAFPGSVPRPQPDSNRVEERIQPVTDQKLADKTNDPEELIKKTKHPEFILEGVLWSDNPDRRVALINDRYLKEGDTIKGVSVVKIEKKAVTLQSGQEKWTLRVKK